MGDLFLDVLRFIVPWLFGVLKDKSSGGFDQALEVAGDVIREMLEEAENKGLGQLSVEFRAPYEVRLTRALDAAGLLETA